nr:PREDICTED: cell division cycle-associated protein 2 isoform X1 [Anolis carolinensis]|eukprot:XP_008118061.1 PREDICTED: cell division cycle-associated protein 2 isoform X1 [Anolis carolinensis]
MASLSTHNTCASPKRPSAVERPTYLTPRQSGLGPKQGLESTAKPLDFSTLTAADFGITPESFTKQTKGQSKNVLNKLGRRSTIGIRGSPENNSLIRYIAYQRRARKQDALLQASPFTHQNTFLKDKIAAFQSSFKSPEETEERQIHVAETSKEINAGPHEELEEDQNLPLVCGTLTFEENTTVKSLNGGKTSPDIQEHNIVSPSSKPFHTDTGETTKALPGLLASSAKSGGMILKTTPCKGVSRTPCGKQFSHASDEVNQSATIQKNCKKVRFAEQQSLELFDETKPPVTPVQRNRLSFCSARPVLKKRRVETGDKEVGIEHHLEHIYDTKDEFSADPGSTANERTTKSDEVIIKNEDLDSDDIPLHKKRVLLSSSVSRGSSPNMSPEKESFSQSDVDRNDNQEASKGTESAADDHLEETSKHSFHIQDPARRITRSSAINQHYSKIEETDFTLASKMQIKNSKHKANKIQKTAPEAKSVQKKKPAAKCRVFGKRRKRKKKQKALYGQRETASKTPLLSPILEVTEDISFGSSYQHTPESCISIFDSVLDDSILSDLRGESENGRDENSCILRNDSEDGDSLHSSLCLLKELDMSTSFSPLADDDANVLKNMLPLESPKQKSPKKLKIILNEKEEALNSDYSSGIAKKQQKHEILHSPRAEGTALFSVESAAQLGSESGSMNRNKIPKRKCRRQSFHLLNHSETPGNIHSIPEGNMEELSLAPADSELLHSIQCSIEASFSSTSRRVRRSMRRDKNAEKEGLAWIQIPDSACVIKRRLSSIPQESELLPQKEAISIQLPFLMSEEQENAHVPTGPYKVKKRKSIGVLSAKENNNVVLKAQRSRRASLGYKSDYCY